VYALSNGLLRELAGAIQSIEQLPPEYRLY